MSNFFWRGSNILFLVGGSIFFNFFLQGVHFFGGGVNYLLSSFVGGVPTFFIVVGVPFFFEGGGSRIFFLEGVHKIFEGARSNVFLFFGNQTIF